MIISANIKVIGYANGNPLEGMLVHLTLRVSRKNDFTVISKPTKQDGSVVITWPEIEQSADADRNFFIMDYTGLGDFTGEIVVTPVNRARIEAALAGYDMWKGYQFQPNYVENLQRAKEVLENIAPAQLSVEVEHDGEGITIYTETVQA